MTALRKRAEEAASNLLRRPDEWPDPRWEQERNRIADAIEREAKAFAERALAYYMFGRSSTDAIEAAEQEED
jgi:hypothetical protein